MRECQRCGKQTANTKLCTECKREHRFTRECLGCGVLCSGFRCRKCNISFLKGNSSIQAAGVCEDCGKVVSESAKRCRPCANRAMKPGKMISGRHNGMQNKPAKINRCPQCGARIETKRCYGCEIAEKRKRELETRRLLESKCDENRVQPMERSKPKSTKGVGRKSAPLPSHLCHPDIMS